MSTHKIENREKQIQIVTGYDPGQNTFFAQIWDLERLEEIERTASDEDLEPLVWIGTKYDQILSVEALKTELGDYAELLTPEIEQQLAADRKREFHEPTPLQRQMRELFKN